jgi:phenylacetate-CoA ligase
MNGPGVAFECVYKDGMHVWEDAYIIEIINPDTLEPARAGEVGEIVFTSLQRKATPILRYRTRDLTYVYADRCPCGRSHRRIGRIKGRTDDMLILNGVNVFPSQIEEVIMKIPEVGTNYQIVVEKKESLDRITIKIEIHSEVFRGDFPSLEALKSRIKDNLKAAILVNPAIELHEPGMLPVYEGKAKRVLDQRPAF